MKKLMPIIVLVLLLGGGYYLYTTVLGGSVGGPTKDVDPPDVNVPDAGEAADQTEKGAKGLADWIAGLPPSAWRLVAIGLAAGAVWWMIKDPRRRALALLVGIIALLVFIIGGR